MNRALKIGVWFAIAAVVGLASAGRTGPAAPAAAKVAPVRAR